MAFTSAQPDDSASVPISSIYSPQNNTFPAMQGADGAFVDAFGNASTAPVMSFIQPRVVQRAIAVTGAGANSLSCTFANPNIGGNSIVVCLGVGAIEKTNVSFQITDTNGNNYTETVSSLQGGSLESAIFLATGIKPGINVATITIMATSVVLTGISMKVYEIWGLVSSPIDAVAQTVAGNNANSLVSATAPITSAIPNTIAFTAVAVGKITTITPALGWSANDGTMFPWGGNLGAFDSQYHLISSIVTSTPQAALSLSSPWAMCSAVFRTIVVPIEGIVIAQQGGQWAVGLTPGQNIVEDIEQQGYIALSSPPSITYAGNDTPITFSSQVNRVIIQNNTSNNVNYAFDTVSSAGSLVLVPGAFLIYPKQCTVLHLYTATAQKVNGSAANNIVVLGAL